MSSQTVISNQSTNVYFEKVNMEEGWHYYKLWICIKNISVCHNLDIDKSKLNELKIFISNFNDPDKEHVLSLSDRFYNGLELSTRGEGFNIISESESKGTQTLTSIPTNLVSPAFNKLLEMISDEN